MEENEQIFYKESQRFTILIILSIIFFVIIAFSGIFSNGPLGFGFAIFWIAILLFFYKLDIVITSDHAYLKFGIGLIKRVVDIRDLNTKEAQTITVPWYWGLGIRLTPHGWLYNTKPGSALLIPTHSGKSKLFVSTSNTEKIIKAVADAQVASNT